MDIQHRARPDFAIEALVRRLLVHASTLEVNVADIVLKSGGGAVSTKVEVLNGDQAASSSMVWVLDGTEPDHFKQDHAVKTPDDPEGQLYAVGAVSDLDDKYLEWVWTATRAPGSTAPSGKIRITVVQGNTPVDGYPLVKSFDFDDAGPVTYSLTRHLRAGA